MAVVKVVEMQDADGNIIHPHTEAKATFFEDGKSLEDKIKEDVLETDIRNIFHKYE